MFKKLKDSMSILARIVAVIYLVVFFIWSIKFSPSSGFNLGAVLQLMLITALFIKRARQKVALGFIPDEMLVCLPYFWSLGNSGSAPIWFNEWKGLLLTVFAISMLAIPLIGNYFAGGLRKNSLLQATVCATVFVALFAGALHTYFRIFTDEIYRAAMLNLVVLIAGIPISLVAFYGLLETSAASSSSSSDGS